MNFTKFMSLLVSHNTYVYLRILVCFIKTSTKENSYLFNLSVLFILKIYRINSLFIIYLKENGKYENDLKDLKYVTR